MVSTNRSWPDVTLIVLNWNARSLLARCLPALLSLDYPDFRVVVVDNASTDGSVDYVRDHFPQVELIENDVNLGFAAGNNSVLAQVQTEVAVLVNPDVVVEPLWLQELVAGLTSDDKIGVAGCKTFYPGGERLQHAGGYIIYPQAMPGYYGLNKAEGTQPDTIRDVDYVVGAAFAVRRSLLDEIGLLDEGFFLYYEDVDLCVRARRAGYRVVYVPQAEVIHEESVLTEKGSRSYLGWFHSSRWRFLLKHRSGQELLQETVPAERAWLEEHGDYNPAMAHAFSETLRHFHMILKAREEHGAPALTVDETQQLLAGVSQLHQTAWQTPHLDYLKEHWELQEFTFPSRIPLLGAVLSSFRALWNSIATRRYVRPLAAQQSEFNRLVAERAQEQHEKLVAYDRQYEQLGAQLSQRRRDLAALLERLRKIDQRLRQIEENLSPPSA